jgi:hypothetical protein
MKLFIMSFSFGNGALSIAEDTKCNPWIGCYNTGLSRINLNELNIYALNWIGIDRNGLYLFLFEFNTPGIIHSLANICILIRTRNWNIICTSIKDEKEYLLSIAALK